MKQFGHKTKKHSAINQKLNLITKIPTTSSSKHHIGCQPKTQPNVSKFSQFANPRLKDCHRKDDLKQNYNNFDNHIQTGHNSIKPNVLLKDQRKSHQSNHDENLRKTQKRIKNHRQEKGLKGKTEWVSVDEDEKGGLGCNQYLNSQIFKVSLQHSKLSQPKNGQTNLRLMNEEQLLHLFQSNMVNIYEKQEYEKLTKLVEKEEKYSQSIHYIDYLQHQKHITWMNRAFVLNWMMLLASQLHCRRQTYANAVNLLDRYLGVSQPLLLDNLQLLGSTCLLISQKLQDNGRVQGSCFWLPIKEKYEFEQILSLQVDVCLKLKFKLHAPTINSWVNRLCAQWDLYVSRKQDIYFNQIQFKSGTPDSYQNFRCLTQYVDFAILDIQTLQYKNRTLAAAFLYLTIILKLQIFSPLHVANHFRAHSSFVLNQTPYNLFYSNFLYDSFGFPLEDILPAVQYCSIFVVLPLSFQMPSIQKQGAISFQQYCGIQTWNESNKSCLNKIDRNPW